MFYSWVLRGVRILWLNSLHLSHHLLGLGTFKNNRCASDRLQSMYSLLCSSYIENLDVEGQIFLVTTISIFSSKGFAVYLLSFLYSGGYTRLQGGRWSDSRALSCVERFDTFSQYWTTVSSLHQARCGLGVAVLGGMVYAIGGNNENVLFRFLDCNSSVDYIL